jgi:hypothetical protein
MASSALHTSTIVSSSNPYALQDLEFHVSLILQASDMSAVRLHSLNFAEVDTVAITFKRRHTLIMPAIFSSLFLTFVDSFRVWDVDLFPFVACVTRPTFHHATMQHVMVNTPLHRKCSQRASHSVFMSGNLFCSIAIEAVPTIACKALIEENYNHPTTHFPITHLMLHENACLAMFNLMFSPSRNSPSHLTATSHRWSGQDE